MSNRKEINRTGLTSSKADRIYTNSELPNRQGAHSQLYNGEGKDYEAQSQPNYRSRQKNVNDSVQLMRPGTFAIDDQQYGDLQDDGPYDETSPRSRESENG